MGENRPDGFLIVDKPAGISSAGVVAAVKRTTGVRKAGHTGTLDPFATGVLVCCLNRATRLSRFFLDGSKRYDAEIRLGTETDTQDFTGRVTAEMPWDGVSEAQIRSCAARFEGWSEQLPPVYSALKHRGKPLYRLAREGAAVQKPPRRIRIYAIRIVQIDLPRIRMQVHCSAGTYIRTLAVDMARALGTCGHLSALRRTASSHFDLSMAVALDDLPELVREGALERHVISLAEALRDFPSAGADAPLAEKIRHGRPVYEKDLAIAGIDTGRRSHPYIKVVDRSSGDLLAVLETPARGKPYGYCCVFAG